MANRDFIPVTTWVLTVSDSRTPQTDESGNLVAERLEQAGHRVDHRAIVPDDLEIIRSTVQAGIDRPTCQVIVTTGGTGITGRDVTPDAIEPLITRPIPGFGELFRWLSYEEIGTSTIQSRALAGLCGDTLVFALPGSPSACATALDKILLPQLDVRHRPCNFVELFPRIRSGGGDGQAKR